MNFEKFDAIQKDRPHLREMPDATAVGDYRNQGCGDGYRVFLKVDRQGVIREASFTTTGCGFGLAALSLACAAAEGKTLEEAERLRPEDIEQGVEGFPERRKNYPESALEALRVAIAQQRAGGPGATKAAMTREDVLRRHAAGEPLSGLDVPNLDLSGASLRGARFDGGNWSGTDFSGADLTGASFHKCKLRGAKAAGSRFAGANLRRCDLYNADLSGADLTDADLRNSFLNDADVRGAVFARAQIGFAKFTGAKLDGARFEGAFFDAMTRFDPGVVAPFDVMTRREDSGGVFFEEASS
jgi:NifU-like protein involved in Fe-S cluster formation